MKRPRQKRSKRYGSVCFYAGLCFKKGKIETGEVQMANKFSKRMVLAIDLLIIIGFEGIVRTGVGGVKIGHL